MTTKKQLCEISERARYQRDHFGDPRKMKRYERKMLGDGVHYAFQLGMSDGEWRKEPRNPFPKGRRHDEYERGYRLADPLAIYYGSGR